MPEPPPQFFPKNKSPHLPMQQAYGGISGLIAGQATTLAYIDVISFLALMVLCLAPFVLIMRKPKQAAVGQGAH